MEIPNNEKIDIPESAGWTEKLSRAEARIAALELENARLREEIIALKAVKPADAETTGFVEASGVLWKQKPAGGYESIPYCPTCKSTLGDYSGSLLCLKCNWQAPIKSFEVPKVFNDLFGEGSR
ncbi:MAG: hypothetical protein JW913_04285 [Chitinispirillaceae bacterium]|nr:hypothetical protein [Chitinispirillaceae bacterium]